MQVESGSSKKSPRTTTSSTIRRHSSNTGDDFAAAAGDDLGKFVGDASFSDVTSDDSSGWMHKIDVTNFQRLTSTSSSVGGSQLEFGQPPMMSTTLIQPPESDCGELKEVKTETAIDALHDGRGEQPWFGNVTVVPAPAPASYSSRPSSYQNDGLSSSVFGRKLSSPPPRKKSRQGDQLSPQYAYIDQHVSSDHQQLQPQISVVSSTTDAASRHIPHRQYPKPVYSYSCMIALALKNSRTGRLQVAEIYCFMCENYPYFRTAPAGWKNSVRHNLSLNKCFEKIEVEAPGGHGRKCCLWTLNPQKEAKMDQEIRKYREKDPIGVREAYANPDDMELVEQGLKGMPIKLDAYQSSGRVLARQTSLPDAVHRNVANPDGQLRQEYHTSALLSNNNMPNDDLIIGAVGAVAHQTGGSVGGKSELALKLLHRAAYYRQHQWIQHTPNSHSYFTAASSGWLPPQLENNQSSSTTPPIEQQHCPLELPPLQYYGDRSALSTMTPPCSTPILRQSPLAASSSSYSPFSFINNEMAEGGDDRRPPSLQQHNQSQQESQHYHRTSPMFRGAYNFAEYARQQQQHRTPERPNSCGYFVGSAAGGGNDTNSLLVTPTSESLQQHQQHQRQQQRRSIFGTPLEAAFCAASAQNNSLLLQQIGSDDQPSDTPQQPSVYPLFQPVVTNNSSSAGSFNLTSL